MPSSMFHNHRNSRRGRDSIPVPRYHLMACRREEGRRTFPAEELAVLRCSLGHIPAEPVEEVVVLHCSPGDIPEEEGPPFLRSGSKNTIRNLRRYTERCV